jgi:hypothetical protein
MSFVIVKTNSHLRGIANLRNYNLLILAIHANPVVIITAISAFKEISFFFNLFANAFSASHHAVVSEMSF